MLTIEEIRAKYPQYKDKSDRELLSGLHRKFYSQIPEEEFFAKFNLPQETSAQPMAEIQAQNIAPEGAQWGQILKDVASSPFKAGESFGSFLKNVPGQVKDLYQQFDDNPREAAIRQLQSAGRGIYGIGKGLANADENINQYMQSRGLPAVVPAFGEELREIGRSPNAQALDETIMSKLTPENMRPGDSLVEGMASFLPFSKLKAPLALGAHAIAQNENPLAAAFIPHLAKASAKALGNTPKVIGKTAKGIVNAPSRTKAASSVGEAVKAAEKTASGMFDKVLKNPQAKNISVKSDVPVTQVRTMQEGGLGKYGSYLSKIKDKPTPANFQRAQSDLGKFIRSKESAIEKGNAPANVIDAVFTAKKVQKNLNKSLAEAFKESGNATLTGELLDARKYYKDNVNSYRKYPSINEYLEGQISGADLVKTLANNKKFKKAFGERHPEILISNALTGYGKFDPLVDALKAAKTKVSKELEGK